MDHGDAGVSVTDFELPNVGSGPDPLVLSELAAREDVDTIILLFQRDYHCRNCRRQVQTIGERYDEFQAANAVVVSVVPEPVEQARRWQDMYTLPFPLLADPAKEIGAQYGQPTRFGVLGELHDLIGRMPEAVILDTRDGALRPIYVHKGSLPGDRPSVDDLLDQVRRLGRHGEE